MEVNDSTQFGGAVFLRKDVQAYFLIKKNKRTSSKKVLLRVSIKFSCRGEHYEKYQNYCLPVVSSLLAQYLHYCVGLMHTWL